ncbi:MAG: hypothetical protein N2383_16150, partial [Caldilineales bacterium]|nr:hypothetical protein [Caldilineales bacterium]
QMCIRDSLSFAGAEVGHQAVAVDEVGAEEAELLAPRRLRLEVDEAARGWLLAQNEHPEWGARPLRRILQKHLREPLADYLLAHDPPPDAVVRMRLQNGRPVFSVG